MPSETTPPEPPVDPALAALMASPEFQAQMAALTQQAMAQLQALVESLRQFEPNLPPPPPPIEPPAPVEAPPQTGGPDPLPDDGGISWAAVMPVDYPIFIADLEPPPPPLPIEPPPVMPPASEVDMVALTQQALAQVTALAAALKAAEAELGRGTVQGLPAPQVGGTARTMTEMLATSETSDMLAVLPPVIAAPPEAAAAGGAALAEEPPLPWLLADHVRAGAEGGLG